MSKDGNLRQLFRRNLPEFFWTSVETPSTEPGVPDSFYCKSGCCGWVEFKKASANKVSSLTPVQVAWHARLARKGGKSFFAVRVHRELHLVAGEQGAALREGGLAAANPLTWKAPWPWQEVGRTLLEG